MEVTQEQIQTLKNNLKPESQSQNLYEEVTIGELLTPGNIPHIQASMSRVKNLPSNSSKQCMNKILNYYSKKQKDIIHKQHKKYLKNVVKNISTGLLKFYKNQKSIEQVFQQHQRNSKKIYDTNDKRLRAQKQINLQRKYNISLSLKYATLKQAQQIAQSKQKIRRKQSDMQFSKQPLIVKMKKLVNNYHQGLKQPSNNNGQNSVKNTFDNIRINNYYCSKKQKSTELSNFFDSSSKFFESTKCETETKSSLYRKKRRKFSRYSSTINVNPLTLELSNKTTHKQFKQDNNQFGVRTFYQKSHHQHKISNLF